MSAEKLYPNYDMNIWMRTCEDEINEPLDGKITGEIPKWLQGTLLRNGPGCNKIGDSQYGHVFDGLALIHKFAIKDDRITYQCRFIRSETYKRNKAANRIVVTEFGTKAVPDPCRTIFDRVSSIFHFSMERTDNTAVSVYPFGDQIYAMTEVPVMYKINPVSLETLDKETFVESLVVCHTAHPHLMPNGDVYNVGLHTANRDLRHVIVKFSHNNEGKMFETAEIVCGAVPRWRLNPAYMHSFGITENYFVIIEQPLVISLLKNFRRFFISEPFSSTIVSYPEYETNIILLDRKTGEEKRYSTDTIYFMHTINAFEQDGKLMVDMCSYKDAKIIDAMYISALEDMQRNPDYGEWVKSRPKRIVIPLDAPSLSKVEARLLADVGVEAPQINYKSYNGKPYKYFYGIASDVDSGLAGSILKVDTTTGEYLIWRESKLCYPSEPVFIEHPNAQDEDDGVLLSAVLWGEDDHAITLLVLDAKNLHEIARCDFTTPSQTTRCFHGYFLPDKK